jgi:hypothetical protein
MSKLPAPLDRLPFPGHRLTAVHHQQPQAGDCAVHCGCGGGHARAQRPAGRATGRMADRDHPGAGRSQHSESLTNRRPPLPSTRSFTRATTGWSTTWRCASSTRCPSSSPAGCARRHQRRSPLVWRRGAARRHQQQARPQGDRKGRRWPDCGGRWCRWPCRCQESVCPGAGNPPVV